MFFTRQVPSQIVHKKKKNENISNLEHHEVLIKHLNPTFYIVVVVDLFKKGLTTA